MKIINFNQSNSLFNQFLSEIRDVHVQGDRIRFRRTALHSAPQKCVRMYARASAFSLPHIEIQIQNLS